MGNKIFPYRRADKSEYDVTIVEHYSDTHVLMSVYLQVDTHTSIKGFTGCCSYGSVNVSDNNTRGTTIFAGETQQIDSYISQISEYPDSTKNKNRVLRLLNSLRASGLLLQHKNNTQLDH